MQIPLIAPKSQADSGAVQDSASGGPTQAGEVGGAFPSVLDGALSTVTDGDETAEESLQPLPESGAEQIEPAELVAGSGEGESVEGTGDAQEGEGEGPVLVLSPFETPGQVPAIALEEAEGVAAFTHVPSSRPPGAVASVVREGAVQQAQGPGNPAAAIVQSVAQEGDTPAGMSTNPATIAKPAVDVLAGGTSGPASAADSPAPTLASSQGPVLQAQAPSRPSEVRAAAKPGVSQAVPVAPSGELAKGSPVDSVLPARHAVEALLARVSAVQTRQEPLTAESGPVRMDASIASKAGGEVSQGGAVPAAVNTSGSVSGEVSSTSGSTPRVSLETVAVFTVRSVRHLITARGETITVRLIPESLGEMQIQIRAAGSAIEVRLASLNPMVREALQEQLAGLRESFAREGIEVSKISVTPHLAAEGAPNGQSPRHAGTTSPETPRGERNYDANERRGAAGTIRRDVHEGALDVLV